MEDFDVEPKITYDELTALIKSSGGPKAQPPQLKRLMAAIEHGLGGIAGKPSNELVAWLDSVRYVKMLPCTLLHCCTVAALLLHLLDAI